MLNSIFSAEVTWQELLAVFGASMVLGCLTSLVFSYRSRHSGSFALTVAVLPMIVALVIFLVNGNIGAGIAVAGAFALVRFRSVPGTAQEIAALFTSMAMGLALGMGYIGVAALFFVLVACFALALTAFGFGAPSGREKQLKITIPEDFNYEDLFDDIFARYTKSVHLDRVHTTNMGTLFELTYHVTFPDARIPKEFIDELRTRNGNLNIAIGTVPEHESL